MKEELIAPCGMNCRLCISYQFMQKDLNKKGLNRKYCPGCIPRGKHCTFMSNKCELLGKGKVRFCYECDLFPCDILKALDKRYSTKYNMSMINNLSYIKDKGMDMFLKDQEEKWKCNNCDEIMTCHGTFCLNCNFDKYYKNK